MKVEVLYPEVANLYGEISNIKYLMDSCKELEAVGTSLNDEPLFVREKPALIYIGSMSEHYQKVIIEKLMPYRDRLWQLIEEGTPVLATGNAMEIFGNGILQEDGEMVECLAFFDTVAKQKMMNRHNSLYLGKFRDGSEEFDIVGFKSQFTHSYSEHLPEPLFETTRGVGIDGTLKGEGIRYKNFMGTYVLGPLLILNPLFTKYLLRLIGADDDSLAFEDVAMDVYETRLKEFKEPERGFTY